MVGTVEAVSKGVVGGEVVVIALLLLHPVEELEGEGGVSLDF